MTLTSWPKRLSQSTVWLSVRTTPLVWGNHASVTIMILMAHKARTRA